MSRAIYHIFTVQNFVLILPRTMYLTQIISFTSIGGMTLCNYDTNNIVQIARHTGDRMMGCAPAVSDAHT